jgi:predicted phosphodiesterase
MKRVLAAIAVLSLLAMAGTRLYGRYVPVKLDLSPLAAISKTQSYAALEKVLAATPVPSQGFSFVVLGDTQSHLDVAEAVVKRAMEEHPVLILHAGDISRKGTPEEYFTSLMPLVKAAAPVPIIPVPGNHDKGPNGDFAPFRAVYGDVRFSFDYGDCRFVGVPSDEKRGISDDDWRHLRQELTKPGIGHKFVVMHAPPLFVTQAALPEDGRGFTTKENEFRALMVEMKVDGVFLGHIHGFGSADIDGVRYVITGGAGADLTKRVNADARAHNFILVHVAPNGVQSEVFTLASNSWSRQTL